MDSRARPSGGSTTAHVGTGALARPAGVPGRSRATNRESHGLRHDSCRAPATKARTTVEERRFSAA